MGQFNVVVLREKINVMGNRNGFYRMGPQPTLLRPTPQDLTDAGWSFTNTVSEIPLSPGIYAIHSGQSYEENKTFLENDEWLYVGKSEFLRERLTRHPHWLRAQLEFQTPIIFYWAYTEILRRQLLFAESYAIGIMEPLWNFGAATGTAKKRDPQNPETFESILKTWERQDAKWNVKEDFSDDMEA